MRQFGATTRGDLEVLAEQKVVMIRPVAVGGRCPRTARQSGSCLRASVRALRHSGRRLLAALAAGLGLALLTPAQQVALQVDLRGGDQLQVTALRGSPADGYRAEVDGRERRLDPADVLAIRSGAARAAELLRAELRGGDVVYGALAGGDEIGDGLELLSPVLGKVALPIDRLRALVQPGVHLADQRLPEGVDEAVFVPTGRGYDLVAGTLHRFGPGGVSFQAEASDAPRWYAPTKFSSVQLRAAMAPEQPSPATLWTRTADRVGVRVRSFEPEGVTVELEGGEARALRWADVACVVFHEQLVHLSDLEPTRVVESAFDGVVAHPWQRDGCVAGGGELQVLGRAYGRGIGAHSKSRLTFRAPDGATHFRTRVAIDDSAAELPLRAHAVARVLVGADVAFEVDDLQPGERPRDSGLLPVRPGDEVTLVVDFGRGRDLGDRVDWLLPMFLTRAGS